MRNTSPRSVAGRDAVSEIVQRVRSNAEVVLVLVTALVSMMLLLLNLPNLWFVVTVKVITGLIDTCFAPGMVIFRLIYRHDDQISHLLKWVLVLLLSAVFEVVLATVMSVSGIMLNYTDITVIQGLMLFSGALVLTVLGWRRQSESIPRRPVLKRVRNAPLIVGTIIAAVVISMFLPKLTNRSPAIYLTDSVGELSLLQLHNSQSNHILVHVVNPTSRTIHFILRETITGSTGVISLNHTLSPRQTWTLPISVRTGEPMHLPRRVTITLTQSHDPNFRRTVWFYHR